jgi:hypothetical protein
MEIQSLKVSLTDADIAGLAAEHMPKNDSIEGLQVRLTPEGVLLQGRYATGFGFKVPFETVWQLTAAGPRIDVKLDTIKVAGLPGGMLRTVLMRMVHDNVENQAGISVAEDTIQIDIPAIAKSHGAEVRVNFTAVRMSAGTAVVEVG